MGYVEMAVAQLQIVAAGHPEFFQALGRFAAAGFHVDIVLGNHDVELLYGAVQSRFVELVSEASGDTDAHERITFYPWIYHLRGVLYAEHGNQYDDVNSFRRPLKPYLPDEPGHVELPLGSYFVKDLFNRVEDVDPFADNWRPVNQYILWSFRVHPVLALLTLGHFLRFLFIVGTSVRSRGAGQEKELQAAYHRDVLRPYAEGVGISYEGLVAIDGLSATPALSSRIRLLKSLVFEPLLPALPLLGGLIALYKGVRSRRTPAHVRSLALFGGGILGLAWRERRLLMSSSQPFGYLHRAAHSIHRILRAEHLETPFYVFGHTHTAEQFPLGIGEHAPRYINSGTWTPVLHSTFDLLGARERFSFAQITHHPQTGRPLASLQFWNDAAGRSEPLPLLRL